MESVNATQVIIWTIQNKLVWVVIVLSVQNVVLQPPTARSVKQDCNFLWVGVVVLALNILTAQMESVKPLD